MAFFVCEIRSVALEYTNLALTRAHPLAMVSGAVACLLFHELFWISENKS